MKGQGSTEYLVIFAAVLVVALIVIFLLGQFTGFGRESLVDQSKGYWSGKKPIAITDWTIAYGGTQTFLLKNNDVQKVTVYNITTADYTFADTAGSITLASGATDTLDDTETVSECDNSNEVGNVVEFTDVIIYYSKPEVGSTVFAEAGTVPIRAYCS